MRMNEMLKCELIKHFDTNMFEVDLIHNEMDLCVRSYQREILYSIKEYYETKNIYFTYTESIYGKCIFATLSSLNENNIQIVSIEPIYKKYFITRANKIISSSKKDKSEIIKNQFEKLINDEFKMEEYSKMRELLETLL
tara:strand:- start:6841 stop:7257 length:417 start_codon:yes stop_codon:yes gene_type:complete